MEKRALITGILGQDGSYMAELLHSKGYKVHGIVRENTSQKRIDLMRQQIGADIHRIDILNEFSLFILIKRIAPHEIYNFAGISDVFNAWNDLDKVSDLNARLPQHILEIIFEINKSIKFFQASSCLIFGNNNSEKQNELTPRCPIYPYGAAKLYADNMISEARKKFGLFACSGIFFPHESERRGNDFFTKKVTSAVAGVKLDVFKNKLKLGNLNKVRDWGYAPDYMNAAYLMLQAKEPSDYVIGTGILTKTEDFVKMAFDYINEDYKKHIDYDETLNRDNDTNVLCADISRIKADLGWSPKTSVEEMIKIMIENAEIV